ncbi:hypothetical protein [Bradyrhizobium diazoefficiens]|uniref:hypothetical protein n=1 Tax=Bradyrhizobium diazoefficiens TaxID=1355477 RepID=UPI00272C0833|nr:hypothetical protein [Bradyrhizobium diazoefficiens]WLA62360.1 hypothetical protein QNN01_28250 [Bradyrhizobium diazoefficiens]
MTNTEQIRGLRTKLEDKTQEILKLVASSYGLGDIGSLEECKLQHLHEEIEEIIDQHDEALMEGDTPEEWRALDGRLAKTELGRLLQERHEVAEQILNLLDEDAGLGEEE